MHCCTPTVIAFLFIYCNLSAVSSERIRDQIYVPLNGASCFRRLNGTHQTGCSSKQSGSVGVLHVIEKVEDFEFLLNSPPAPPYAPIIPPHLFTAENILRLKREAGANISVVLLINQTNKMTNFSHELKCPNQYSGLTRTNSTETSTCDAQQPGSWFNPWGTGLLHEDMPFAIYYITDDDEIDKLVACFEKFNRPSYATQAQRSLCAVEIKSFMSAAVNSETCMRRTNFINNLGRTRYCDPLQGRNVYATLFPRVLNTQAQNVALSKVPERYILVTCRLDTTSMFDGMGLGALDSLLGYAVLVSVAHTLAQLIPARDNLAEKNLNVLFVIFNGESYDYIGSQRFVYDLEHSEFPPTSTKDGSAAITFENIEFLLDIGVLDDASNMLVHTYKPFPQSLKLVSKLQYYAKAFDAHVNFSPVEGLHLPPTALQSFLRKNISFPGLVVNSKPLNKFYHSIYDDSENIKFKYANTSLDYTVLIENGLALQNFAAESLQIKVRNISSVIAFALYELLTGQVYAGNALATPVLVDEFLHCFLESADCALFKAASHPESLPGMAMPPLRYISVEGSSQESSGWTYRLLGYILSKKVNDVPKDSCTTKPLHWFAGYNGKGECRLTTQNYSVALSPAFLMEDYDWSSGQYSSWTESTWMELNARIFLRPSHSHENFVLLIGTLVMILSFGLVYKINASANILFGSSPNSMDTLSEPTPC